jgi:hypothetical protein
MVYKVISLLATASRRALKQKQNGGRRVEAVRRLACSMPDFTWWSQGYQTRWYSFWLSTSSTRWCANMPSTKPAESRQRGHKRLQSATPDVSGLFLWDDLIWNFFLVPRASLPSQLSVFFSLLVALSINLTFFDSEYRLRNVYCDKILCFKNCKLVYVSFNCFATGLWCFCASQPG